MGSLEPTSLRSIAPESVSTFKLLKLPIDSGSEMFIPQPFPLSIINFSNFSKFPISLGRSSKFSRQEISNSTKLIRVPNCDGRCFIAGSYFVMERVVTFSGATKACSKLSNDSARIMEVKVIHMLAMNRWFFMSGSPDFPYNGCLRVVQLFVPGQKHPPQRLPFPSLSWTSDGF